MQYQKLVVKSDADAKRVYIDADEGASNSSRSQPWKTELQGLANKFKKEIHVRDFPLGTTKRNKIEINCSFISVNWKAKPLISLQVIRLIAATARGLKVNSKINETHYQKESGSLITN